MGRLTQWVVIEADIAVRDMSQDQKVHLADEIYAQQPNMLASILALPRMGVDMAQLEVALHILLVTFQAMKLSGHRWPLITEDIQDGCLQRLTARARFNEGLPQELATKVVEQFHNEHAERYLMAFVYGYLGDHDLMAVRTEAEKYLMLGALNLVECVAFAGAIKPKQKRSANSCRQDGTAGRSLFTNSGAPPCPPRRLFVAGDAAAVDKAARPHNDGIEDAFGTGLPTRRRGAAWATRQTPFHAHRGQRSKLMADSWPTIEPVTQAPHPGCP